MKYKISILFIFCISSSFSSQAVEQFDVANGTLAIPDQISFSPFDDKLNEKFEKALKCAGAAFEEDRITLSESEIEEIYNFAEKMAFETRGSSFHNPVHKGTADILNQKYKTIRPLLKKMEVSSTMKHCFLTIRGKENYHGGAPKICPKVFPHLDTKTLSDFYRAKDSNEQILSCNGPSPIDANANELSSTFRKIQNNMLEDQKTLIKKGLKELALKKILEKRKDYDALATDTKADTELRRCSQREKLELSKDSLKSQNPMPSDLWKNSENFGDVKDKDIKKFILAETMNAVLVNATHEADMDMGIPDGIQSVKHLTQRCRNTFQRDKNIRSISNSYNDEVEGSCDGIKMGGHTEETFLKEVIDNHRLVISQKISSSGHIIKAMSGMIKKSDYLFNLNKNYEASNGEKLLEPSKITSSLIKNADRSLLEGLKKQMTKDPSEQGLSDFLNENDEKFLSLMEKNLSDPELLKEMKRGLRSYRSEMTDSATSICEEDTPELHLMKNSFEDLVALKPELFKDEETKLKTLMAWCSIHKDFPPDKIGQSFFSKNAGLLSILELPLQAFPAGKVIEKGLDMAKMADNYITASENQERAKGYFHSSYGDLNRLTGANDELSSATNAIESATTGFFKSQIKGNFGKLDSGRVKAIISKYFEVEELADKSMKTHDQISTGITIAEEASEGSFETAFGVGESIVGGEVKNIISGESKLLKP